MVTGRLGYLDALKGFAMIIIVTVHTEITLIPEWVNLWMTSFFVDAFYIVTGWIYATKSKEFSVSGTVRKRLRQLGVPYLRFSIILLIVTCLWVLIGHFEVETIPIAVFKTLCLRGIGTLWFLPALFFSEIIFVYAISRQFGNNARIKRALFIVALALFSTLFEHAFQHLSYQHRSEIEYKIIEAMIYPYYRGIIGWLMIMAGYIAGNFFRNKFKNCNDLRRRIPLVLTGIMLIVFDLLLFISGNERYDTITKVIMAFVPSLGIMMLYQGLSSHTKSDFVQYVGRNSLILMATHYTITLELIRYVHQLITGANEMGDTARMMSVIICILITYPIVRLRDRFIKNKRKVLLTEIQSTE